MADTLVRIQDMCGRYIGENPGYVWPIPYIGENPGFVAVNIGENPGFVAVNIGENPGFVAVNIGENPGFVRNGNHREILFPFAV